jgi:hypothetical protein
MKTVTTFFALALSSSLVTSVSAAADPVNQLESVKPSVSNQQSQGKTANSKKDRPRIGSRANKTDSGISLSRRTKQKKVRETLNGQSLPDNNRSEFAPKKRSSELTKSSNADGFSIYSATSYLVDDIDGDGYFSDFTLDFDADFDGGYADVYAVIYYSRNGGDWLELVETEVFTIYSDDADDEFSVNSVLNFGFPTGDYDILIDLYEDGVSGYVATVGPDESSDLYALPLEDLEHEQGQNTSQISYVATELWGDFDQDNFYTNLTLEYDIDARYSGDVAYAEIILTDREDGRQQVVYSSDFVLGNQTEFVDLTFNSGYLAGWYDVQINLVNAYTEELIADAGTEFSSLRSLPIESANNDDYYDDPLAVVPDVEVHVSGGGSAGWLLLPLMGLLFFRRKI